MNAKDVDKDSILSIFFLFQMFSLKKVLTFTRLPLCSLLVQHVDFSLLLPHYSLGFHIFPLRAHTASPLGFPSLYVGALPTKSFPSFLGPHTPLSGTPYLHSELTLLPPSWGPHSS